MKNLAGFNEKLFKKGQTVAVALSGGEDSVCLFHFLLSFAKKLGVTVKAVNVEHGIRGENSDKDSEFVKRLCEKSGIELFFKKVDSLTYSRTFGLSVEESARILRYRVFDEALSSGFCDVIATAHHKSDNAETVLFNLFRGAGSIGGINFTAKNGKIIRPLIAVSKDEIRRYISENGLSFVTDETNADENYTRNFIRRKLLPLIKEKFPTAEDALYRFSEISRAEGDFLDELAKSHMTFNGDEVSVGCETPAVLFQRACAVAMKYIGIVKDYEKRHIDLLIALCKKKNGTTIDLPFNVKAVKDYDKITLYKEEERSDIVLPYNMGKTVFGKFKIELSHGSQAKFKDGSLYIDGDKIPSSAVFRNRKEGDEFVKFGGGRKKLKDYLIDKKIPARKRDDLVLLADGNEILLIFGIEISDSIKVDKGTTNVLKCSIYDLGEGK